MNARQHCSKALSRFLIPATCLLAGAVQAEPPPRHLFLDPAFISETKGVALHVNPAQPREVVIRPDRPWEQLMISFYLTVFEDGGKLRLWYICRDAENHPNLAYAESQDGITWTKPNLGIVDYHGSKENNLVGLPTLEGTVFRDPNAKPGEEYIYVSGVEHGGAGLARFFSPDGLRWQRDPHPLLPFRSDTQNVTFWDERLGKYVLYVRSWETREQWDDRRRRVGRLTLDNLHVPSGVVPNGSGATPGKPKETPRIGTETEIVLTADAQDSPTADVYNISAQPYPLDPHWYVGFPSWLLRERGISDGRLEAQFVGSTDGIHWNRYDRAAYARPGLAGSETANMVFLGTGVIVRGDELWQYGTGFRSRHGDREARRGQADGVILRYVQRVDGFVSLDFAYEGGSCQTAPVTVSGARLLLNVDTGAMGDVRVGLNDEAGQPIEGLTEDACLPLHINGTGVEVRWKDRAQALTELAGKTVRLSLHGRGTKLYSFRFE